MVLIYKRVRDFLIENNQSLFWLTLLAVVLITLQQLLGGARTFADLPYSYTHYNNYVIFKFSFLHLVKNKDLYTLYLPDHWDLYKYSPTFALTFGLLAWMPDGLGLLFWNLINAACLFLGVRLLPVKENAHKNLMYLIVFVEMITSLQNSQSNALMAGLVLLGYGMMERKYFFWACLCIAFTVYVKLFGLFAFAICLLYPQRWKMVFYSVFWMTVLWVLPIFITGFSGLIDMYKSWYQLLQQDYIHNSLSLLGALEIWFGWKINSTVMLAAGLLLFALPLVKWKYYLESTFHLLFLSMILIWMVIFNHKAESPTFIIAMTGVAIGYISLSKSSRAIAWLTLFAVIFTSLSTTDLFPQVVQKEFFIPYAVKALPCIIFYFFVLYQLLSYSPNESMRFSGQGRSDQ